MNAMVEHPSVSLVIVCYNSRKWLPRLMESIRAQTIYDQLEVIIADNASEDGSDKLAQDLIAGWPNARWLPTGGNLGYGAGVDRAAAVARGEYLCVLNPDTWLERDCVERLHSAAVRKQAAMAGPTVLNYEDDSLQTECRAGFDFTCNYGSQPAGGDSSSPFCVVAFCLIRRELFGKVGMLDEKFFMYGEEMDLSWRVWISGERAIAVPAARIHHRRQLGVGPTSDKEVVEHRTSPQKRFLANRNCLLTIAKNSQHLLLLLLIPNTLLLVVEGLVILASTRSLRLAKLASWDALTGFWHLRGHVWVERRRIRSFRRRGDLWMLRFFRLGFGRWHEMATILKRGFPKFN